MLRVKRNRTKDYRVEDGSTIAYVGTLNECIAYVDILLAAPKFPIKEIDNLIKENKKEINSFESDLEVTIYCVTLAQRWINDRRNTLRDTLLNTPGIASILGAE